MPIATHYHFLLDSRWLRRKGTDCGSQRPPMHMSVYISPAERIYNLSSSIRSLTEYISTYELRQLQHQDTALSTFETEIEIEILPFNFPPDQISHSRLWPPYLQIKFSNALILSKATSLSITSLTVMGTNTMSTLPLVLPLKPLLCMQAWSTV